MLYLLAYLGDMLVGIMRTDDKFQCVYDDAAKTCIRLGVSATGVRRRKKSRPTAMQDFVMDRYVTASSDALPCSNDEEQMKNELRVDFLLSFRFMSAMLRVYVNIWPFLFYKMDI